MTTFVGIQNNFADALKELVELDYAAIEAYETAIERLKEPTYQQKLTTFKQAHERHVKELSEVLSRNNEEVPTGPHKGKELIAKGKVILANLIGDETILRAMKSNEIDTNTAYERMNDRDDIWDEAKEILRRGLQDERIHKDWLEKTISA